MTVQPTVTVCIPTYNRPEMLRASLQSVLWQSYRDIEVIVSDNASVTDTFEVVESFADPGSGSTGSRRTSGSSAT